MKPSPMDTVRELYEASAASYAALMDSEIDLPVYADILGRLAERIASLPGAVIDTSCGPGHVLHRLRARYDPGRPLVGIDISPEMVALATAKLGAGARVMEGDMRHLDHLEPGTAAAVLSFFAVHHIGPEDAVPTLRAWHRLLQPQGQLVVATWEGGGPIDYGEASDVIAFRYSRAQITDWAERAGFVVNRCVVEPVVEMPMDAIYLEGTKEAPTA